MDSDGSWNSFMKMQESSETSRPCVKADGQSARAVPAHKQTHGRTREETSSGGGLSAAGRENKVQHLNAAEASLQRLRVCFASGHTASTWFPKKPPVPLATKLAVLHHHPRTQQTLEDRPWTRRCSPTISRACGILQMQTLPLVTVLTRGGQSEDSFLKGGGAKSINDVLTWPNPPDLNSALWWCDSSSCRMLLVMLGQITINMCKLLQLSHLQRWQVYWAVHLHFPQRRSLQRAPQGWTALQGSGSKAFRCPTSHQRSQLSQNQQRKTSAGMRH